MNIRTQKGLSADAISNNESNYPLGMIITIKDPTNTTMQMIENDYQKMFHDHLNECHHKLTTKGKKIVRKIIINRIIIIIVLIMMLIMMLQKLYQHNF